MEKNTPVKLTNKWWTDNKAKTLKDKGKLGDALKKYETATKELGSKGRFRAEALCASYAACTVLLKAAKTNASACTNNIHDETCHVMKNSFKTAVTARQKELKTAWEAMRKTIMKMQFDAIYKDKTYRVLLVQRAKENGETNNLNCYLALQKKKDQATYDMYIKPSSGGQSANIKGSLRKEFHKAADEGKLDKAPWAKVKDFVRGQVYANLLGADFATYVMGKADIE